MPEDNKKTDWTKLNPKVVAAIIVGGIVYLLGALGVDLGSVLQDIGEAIGVDVPDQQGLVTLLAAIIAAYFKSAD